MKYCPHREEINKLMKNNPTAMVLTDPFPSQQQLIDHMSSQGTSNSTEYIRMMSTETIKLTTCNQKYDKLVEKKDEGTSSEKVPSTNSSPPPLSNGLLTIEKPNLDLILTPPKSTL